VKFKHKSLAVFSDVAFQHPMLPGVGPVHVKFDYLISSVLGNVNVFERGDECKPGTPYLVVMKESKDPRIGIAGDVEQLYAQLLTLDHCYGYSALRYMNTDR
jgi:hypothetical protein